MQFIYRLKPTRHEMLTQGATAAEEKILQQHFDYLRQLVDAGEVYFAGRCAVEDESTYGLVLFQADDKDAAIRLMESDPAVRDGVMSAELSPFRVALWSVHSSPIE